MRVNPRPICSSPGIKSGGAQNSTLNLLVPLMKMLTEILGIVQQLEEHSGSGNLGGNGGSGNAAGSPLPGQTPSGAVPTKGTPSANAGSAQPQTAQGGAPAGATPAANGSNAPSQAAPGGAPAGATPSGTPPANAIDVKDFGVKGDGSTDDQAGLQAAFDAAKASGKSVWLGSGTYMHSGVLNIDGVNVVGDGANTKLVATNPQESAIKLTGQNSSLSNVLAQSISTDRSSQPDAAAVLVQNASNARVTNVTTIGAGSNGIRLDNAQNSTISNSLVQGSNADGIALMNGSSNNLVRNNVVYQSGDDAFSSDSYAGDHSQDSGNVFDHDMALDTQYGRGFALMGSSGDTVQNSVVSGAKWIGIMAGTDAASGTMTGTNAKISNNLVLNWGTQSGAGTAPVQADGGASVTGTQTSGTAPDPAEILGWTPQLMDRSTYDSGYQTGTGPGSNNANGVRS
jgi:parallel beta-helix repeat protein